MGFRVSCAAAISKPSHPLWVISGHFVAKSRPCPLYPQKRTLRSATGMSALLQVDGLVMPGLVELCTPHLVHTLVVGPAEDHGRAEPNVEVAQIFQSPD